MAQCDRYMPSFFLKASCHSMTFLKILLKFGFFWKEYWLLPICKHGFRGVSLSGAPNYISQLDRLAWFSAATPLMGSLKRSPCWFQYRYNVMELCHAILHRGVSIHIYRCVLQRCTWNISKNVLSVPVFISGFYLTIYIVESVNEGK